MNKEELLRLIDQAAEEGWTELNLSRKALTELPPEIGKLTHLVKLSLSGNQLTTLPPEIGLLTNLEELHLDNYIRDTVSLMVLNDPTLFLNPITGLKILPPEIRYLTNLTKLFLTSNFIKELPQEIGHLTNLTHLYLIDNSNKDWTDG